MNVRNAIGHPQERCDGRPPACRAAIVLNHPPGVAVLELVVTADDHPERVGDVVVHYAAGT